MDFLIRGAEYYPDAPTIEIEISRLIAARLERSTHHPCTLVLGDGHIGLKIDSRVPRLIWFTELVRAAGSVPPEERVALVDTWVRERVAGAACQS